MKINPGNRPTVGERSAIIKKGSVVLGPLKRVSEMLDRDGNTIDRRSKQVIKYNEQ